MQKSSVVPRHFDPIYVAKLSDNLVRWIMSGVVTAAIAVPVSPSVRGAFAEKWSGVATRFYRFLNNFPARFDDVDPEVFKRVPVPV
jgi:hypothetical protein